MFFSTIVEGLRWLGEGIRWVGFIPLYIGFWALFMGVWGGIIYRTSPSAKRARFRAASRDPVFCRECRWAVPDPGYSDEIGWSVARCMHESARERPSNFLVLGYDQPRDMYYCSAARADTKLCGPRGRYWQKGQQVISPSPPGALPAE